GEVDRRCRWSTRLAHHDERERARHRVLSTAGHGHARLAPRLRRAGARPQARARRPRHRRRALPPRDRVLLLTYARCAQVVIVTRVRSSNAGLVVVNATCSGEASSSCSAKRPATTASPRPHTSTSQRNGSATEIVLSAARIVGSLPASTISTTTSTV